MTWYIVSAFWCIISILCRISHIWSYANTIETAVLLAVVYDVVFHQINSIREIKREKEAEERAIQREESAERRQIARERQELIRKHWQELQYNIISLHRVATYLAQRRRTIHEKKDSQDPTTQEFLRVMVTGLHELISEFDDCWSRVVSQLNVFPQPRDVLALEVLAVVEELGKTVGDKQTEITEKTLADLAGFVQRVADMGTLPSGDD